MRFAVVLVVPGERAAAVRRLRQVLKSLLRSYGVRCEQVVEQVEVNKRERKP